MFPSCNWRNIPSELGNNWIGTIRECTLSPSLFLCFFWILLILCLIGSASIGKKGHFSALPLMESDASCPECAGSAMSIKFNKLPIYHLRNLQPRALRFLSSFPSSVQRIITFIVPRLFVSPRYPSTGVSLCCCRLLPASPFLFHSYLASRTMILLFQKFFAGCYRG